MLRGYTLTDLSCDSCGVTPLMREPASAASREDRSPIQFCALCDGRPENATPGASTSTTNEIVLDQNAGSHTVTHEPLTATSSAHSTSRAGPSITDDIPPYISPYDSTPSSGPSTSQADKAAGSISSLLLQGYSLLGDNCPNPICRGIPLVGYPKKKDGTKDGRRMCVSCGGAWVDQADLEGMNIVPPTSAAGRTGRSASRIIDVPRQGGAEPPEVGGVLESPRSKARRELYAQGERIVQETESKKKRANEPVVSSKKGKEVVASVRDDLEEEMDLDEQSAPLPAGVERRTDASVSHSEQESGWMLMGRLVKTRRSTRRWRIQHQLWPLHSNPWLRHCSSRPLKGKERTTTRGSLSTSNYIRKRLKMCWASYRHSRHYNELCVVEAGS